MPNYKVLINDNAHYIDKSEQAGYDREGAL